MAIVRSDDSAMAAKRAGERWPLVEGCDDLDRLLFRAERWLVAEIERTRSPALFIPAGRTPLPLYQRWERARPAFLRDLELYPVDEVVTGPGAGIFARFMAQALPSFSASIHAVTDEADPPPRVALLGLGLNGHVAFHEPHVPRDFRKGVVDLDPGTCTELGLTPPVQGLTYGVGTFRRCDSVAILVSSERKRTILQRLLRGESMPARWLLDAFAGDPARKAHIRIFAETSLLSST
jgi:6-phosphogluconolactonase/glucosamine-6-phosphate isomerase/deaminase